MKQNLTRLILILAASTQFLFFQNCSKVAVSDIQAPSNGSMALSSPTAEAPACTERLENTTNPVKILFLIDNSGSNLNEYDSAGNLTSRGTDNGKVWRNSVMNKIISTYSQNQKISFAILSFQGGGRGVPLDIRSHINTSTGEPRFTNDITAVKDGVASFTNLREGPYTPYQEALYAAKDLIKADINSHLEPNTAYSLVMLSDGVPSTGVYNDTRPDDPLNAERIKAIVVADAQSIMDLLPGQIRLNTVFYSNANIVESDQRCLKYIAETGKGLFLLADSSQPFYLNNLVTYSHPVCQ